MIIDYPNAWCEGRDRLRCCVALVSLPLPAFQAFQARLTALGSFPHKCNHPKSAMPQQTAAFNKHPDKTPGLWHAFRQQQPNTKLLFLELSIYSTLLMKHFESGNHY
jgi:hypothetical protein